jgi:hypothetical protein
MSRRCKLAKTTGTTTHNHGFSLADFVPPPHPENEDITTFVDRVSVDRWRTYQKEVLVVPPSPIKKMTKERLDSELQAQSFLNHSPTDSCPTFEFERYDVAAAVNKYGDEPEPEDITPRKPKYVQPTVCGHITAWSFYIKKLMDLPFRTSLCTIGTRSATHTAQSSFGGMDLETRIWSFVPAAHAKHNNDPSIAVEVVMEACSIASAVLWKGTTRIRCIAFMSV